MKSIGRLVILVKDYDEAIEFYRDKLGFEVFVDINSEPHRFVHLRLPGQPDVGIWLLKASSEHQKSQVGQQTAGQPCAVLYTDNLQEDYRELSERGVIFNSKPKVESNAEYAHFLDLYGNEFVLVELKQ
ncbi:VOC family protein [Microbulbifer thermotolerans]|uniref:Glyoxalase n=1 Tax=Microbulbifer thermotolerans TaxID=252514 RepID=A0A143HLX4_MICTH|nr:VOC family protein [Microbulbifer thermotolerans]AMX02470.1 glyoxalase [Microbulbifer thermotolerans]MCX2833732.1 VOC family protein [Microbulbifer thermotolerans]MCX2840023.1 VOC family protein [Microbulbifer thermotolerans]SFB81934.1 Catechol 2,3-dioxygenase [Microbulbifer thermotolerans]